MAKPPTVNMEHLGAAVDGIATTNAMLFMLLASPEQSDAALRLLDRIARMPRGEDPVNNALRAMVAEATARSIRGLQELGQASPRAAGSSEL